MKKVEREQWINITNQGISKKNLELKKYCNNFSEARKVLIGLGANQEAKERSERSFFFELSNSKQKKVAGLRLMFKNCKDEI